MYRFGSELLCLSKLMCLSKQVEVTDSRKDTSLLQNLSIFRKLRICNVLWNRPLVLWSFAEKLWPGFMTPNKTSLDQIETFTASECPHQGILKGEVSLYPWPPVWNQLHDNIKFLFFQNRLIKTSQTGVQWYNYNSPFSIPCLHLFATMPHNFK
jgi:hypothetical protein